MKLLLRYTTRALIVMLLCFITAVKIQAQGITNRDSLLQQIITLPDDTGKIVIYLKYAGVFKHSRLDSAVYYYEKAGAIAKKYRQIPKYLSYRKNLADAYFYHGLYIPAIEGYRETIIMCLQTRDTPRAAKRMLDLAGVYRAKGNLDTALTYYLKCLPVLERYQRNYDDSICLSILYYHLFDVYHTLALPEASFYYAKKAYALSKAINDELGIGYALHGIASYYQTVDPDRAVLYCRQVISIANKYEDNLLRAAGYVILANVYLGRQDYLKTEKVYEDLLTLLKDNNDPSIEMATYVGLAQSYIALNKLDKGKIYLDKGIRFGDSLHRFAEMPDLLEAGIGLYKKTNNFKAAFYLQEKLNQVNAALASDNVKKNYQKLDIQYKTTQKNKEIAQKQLQLSQKDLALQRQSKWMVGIAAGLLVIILISCFIYVTSKQKQKLQREQLRILQKEKEIQVLDAMIAGEEKERTRIAKDLHDGIGGMLSGVKMHFSTIKNEIADKQTGEKFIHALSLLDDTAREVRKTAHNMMPEMLLRHGLAEAIRIFCRNVGFSDKLTIHYQSFGEPRRYKQSFELSVYRVVQELINNIIKHSNASEAIVQLSEHAEMLTLVVEDNGVGFNKDKLSGKEGIGLASLRSRIGAMHGSLAIDTAEGAGTSAHIEFNTAQMLLPHEVITFTS